MAASLLLPFVRKLCREGGMQDMKRNWMRRVGQQAVPLVAGLFAGWSTKTFAARIDPQELEQIRDTVGMLLEDVEEFYHVTILIESFMIFMLLALIIVGLVGYSKLKKEVRELRRHVYDELDSEKALKKDASVSLEPMPSPAPKPTPEPEPVFEPRPEPESEPESEPELESQSKPEPEAEEEVSLVVRLLEAYGEANDVEDPVQREARFASLLTEFPIKRFACTNPENRKTNLNAPPTFETRDEGDFWAIEKEDSSDDYYVVPNPMIPYSEERHRFCGMKEAFASNYQEGKTYTHMEIEAPARFNLMGSLWAPQRPGKIVLSEEKEA